MEFRRGSEGSSRALMRARTHTRARVHSPPILARQRELGSEGATGGRTLLFSGAALSPVGRWAGRSERGREGGERESEIDR
jgi:hypothetical protein